MTHQYRKHPDPDTDLLDFSPWDYARWTLNRLMCDRITGFFASSTSDLERKIYPKLKRCCDRISFYRDYDEPEDGRYPYKLLYANFCHQRVCLLCQGRLANKWRRRLNRGIPKVERMYPKHHWVFLTLTIKNVPIEDLKRAITYLNQSWDTASRCAVFVQS